MWELDYKEIRALKNWCFWTVVLEKTFESSLDFKEIQPVHPRDQSWVFIGRTDVEAEAPILWLPDGKSWLTWKDPDAGRDWGQEEKGTTEDEMAGWHHRLDGHEFGPSSYQNPCLFVQNLLVWEADFPVICLKFPSLKCLHSPQSPHIMKNSPFYTTAVYLTHLSVSSPMHWQVTEFEIPSVGCCFHYFSACGCSVLLLPTHCLLWLSCL